MNVAQNGVAGASPADAASSLPAARIVQPVGLTRCLCYLIVLGGTFFKGHFLLDAEDRPIANDFVNVVAAGRLALDGKPAAAYDWPTHKQAEVGVIGHDFENYYGWHYPPPFLFAAAALATLPFMTASFRWWSRSPLMRRRCGAFSAALASSLRSAFLRRSGMSPQGKTVFSLRR